MKNRYKFDADTNTIYDTKDYDTEFDVADRLNSQDKKIKELKKQLKEKNKEIKEYNNYFEAFSCKNFDEFQVLIGLAKISANDKDRDDWVRHQVCEEIRESVKYSAIIFTDKTLTERERQLISQQFKDDKETVYDILDQIEKGESK